MNADVHKLKMQRARLISEVSLGHRYQKKGHPVGWPEISLRAHARDTSRGDTEAYKK